MKQSVKHAYFQAESARACRSIVQDFNLRRGANEEIRQQRAMEQEDDTHVEETDIVHSGKSAWAVYDDQEEGRQQQEHVDEDDANIILCPPSPGSRSSSFSRTMGRARTFNDANETAVAPPPRQKRKRQPAAPGAPGAPGDDETDGKKTTRQPEPLATVSKWNAFENDVAQPPKQLPPQAPIQKQAQSSRSKWDEFEDCDAPKPTVAEQQALVCEDENLLDMAFDDVFGGDAFDL